MAKKFAKSFYDSRLWQNARRIALRRDHYCCVYCDARAAEVHHKMELTPGNIDDIAVTLNPDNLISLCHRCHTKLTAGNNGDLREEYIFDDYGQVVPPPVNKNKIGVDRPSGAL
jgi:5-methylcytosine-specific restriction protein A